MKTGYELARLLAYVSGLVNQDLLLQFEYLAAENRILRAHAPVRLRLADAERATLGEIGKRLGRKGHRACQRAGELLAAAITPFTSRLPNKFPQLADNLRVPNFGRFEIVKELGRGGMGVVFRAHDPAMGRDVAVKVLRLDTSLTDVERADISRRFEAEAKAAGGLSHPNIVTHFERGEIDGHKYIVMELVDGPALHDVMSQETRPEPRWYLGILRETAAALDYAHSHGVVHRDIKPANILLQSGETAKVADFGIAKCMLSPGTTATAVMIGSPHYMAPEQIDAKPVSSRTDQWALAVTAYELLAGRKPFQSDSVASLFAQILSAAPPDPAQLTPAIPKTARTVFGRALNKDPEGRFETCTAFVDALEDCFDGIRPTAAVPRPHKRPYGAVAAGVLVLAAAAGGCWMYITPANPSAHAVAPQPAAPAVPTGAERVNRRDALTYIWVAPGVFEMGCSLEDADCEADEQPHHVTLTKGYWIGKTEVTVNAFARFASATGASMPTPHSSNPNWADETRPVSNVAWDQAAAYCRWAQARLPTEAEWEMAARSGSNASRYGDLDEIAWHKGNSGGGPHAVGGKAPNGFGLLDVLGNVWEWTVDRYSGEAPAAAATDPAGPAAGNFRVLKGGSWLRLAAEVRVSNRYALHPDSPDHGIGFRCVADELP